MICSVGAWVGVVVSCDNTVGMGLAGSEVSDGLEAAGPWVGTVVIFNGIN